MNTHANKTQSNKSQSVANGVSQKKGKGESTFQFVNNRPEVIAQRQLQSMADNNSRVSQLWALQEMTNDNLQAKQTTQLQTMAAHTSDQQQPIQKKENNTGLPDNLKTGMENLSGMPLDDVKVHRNSDKPAQLQAHAYAQGTDIHLGPSQEKHLPHEAWHVVQQKQGRVKPTMQMKGNVNINDDSSLEKEADEMGIKALQMKSNESTSTQSNNPGSSVSSTVQKVDNNVIQKYSLPLHQAITEIGGYAFKDPFMQYTAAINQSDKAVDWKAHVGLQDAKDRAKVLGEAGPVLRALGLNHKFDIRDAEDGQQLPKYITIYPPAEESDWAEIIASVESAISAPTYFDENAEKGVMGGKVAMRHGQIGAVLPQHIIEAGIELTKGNTANYITSYTINNADKVWDSAYQNKLIFHAGAGACFFLMDKPFPAIIWEGILRPDRREHWNPFEAELPEGVKTTEEIEWEEKITAYHSSEMYKNREKALLARGEAGRYGI